MIKDENNCREIYLGKGTVGIGADATGSRYIFYEKPFTPVGEKYDDMAGKMTREMSEKSVCLFFEGKDGVKALSRIIEDLQ